MRRTFIVLAMALLALAVSGQAVWAQVGPFDIACEGIESTGGGATRYQYTLRNNSLIAETLTDLYVGTQDFNPANYSGWVNPPPFVPAIIPNTTPVFVTEPIKTPHGAIPPGPWGPCVAKVWWNAPGGVIIPPGGTITFGFNHPGCSQDMEWMAVSAPFGNTVPSALLPIAGPLGVFTQGYVHGPNPVVPATTNWGLVVLVGLLLAVPVVLLVRRRRSVVGTA